MGCMSSLVLQGNAENPLYAEKIPVTIRLVSPAGLVEGEVLHQMERAVNEQKIMEIPKQPPREEALKELVEERFSYQYPYEDEKQIPVKVTVSQLKKAGMEESEIGKELFVQEEFVPIVPGFMKKDNADALTGADRGTAYHRLLECLDYRRAYSITGADGTDGGTCCGRKDDERSGGVYLFQICSGLCEKSGRNADAECISEWNPEKRAAVCNVHPGKRGRSVVSRG